MEMRIDSVLLPLSEDNLRLAAQYGVEDIILRYSGGNLAAMKQLRRPMGVAEIPVCCYNVMPGTAFRLTDAQHAARLDCQAWITRLGRLFAVGYMRGLIQAATHSPTSRVSDILAR